MKIGGSAFSSCANLLLTLMPDPYAHAYAQANDIPYELANDSQGLSAREYAIGFYEQFRESHEAFPDAAVFSLHTDLNEYYHLTKGLWASRP